MLSCAEQPATLASDAINSLRERGFALLKATDVAKADNSDAWWMFLDATIARFLDADGTRREAREYLSGQLRNTRKQYLVKPTEKPTFHAADPLLRLALSPTFLEIASAVFEAPPKLFLADMWLVLPKSDEARTWSQNWHRDSDAEQILKFFYFPFGVTADAGPLEYVEGSHTGGFDRSLHDNGYLPVDFCLPPERIRTFLCKTGALLAVNTRGIHRGGLASVNARISVNWTYVAGKQYPRRFKIADERHFAGVDVLTQDPEDVLEVSK